MLKNHVDEKTGNMRNQKIKRDMVGVKEQLVGLVGGGGGPT